MAEEPGVIGWPIALWLDTTECVLTLTKISDVGGSAEMVDLTNQLSPSNYKEKRKGLRDAGSFTMEINARPGETGDEAILASLASDTLQTISIVWPDDECWSAEGTVTGYKASGGVGEKFSATITIELSGPWNFTATAPTAAP